MITEEIQRYLRELMAAQPTYKPTKAVVEKLKSITFLSFVGAASMGKTTIMDHLVAKDPSRFGKTRNFTSRPPRVDDDPERYYYFEHTDAGLAPLFARIKSHELLQYNIDPFSYYIYGSEVEGYQHEYNLGDIWSTSIEGFRQLGFGKLYVFSVVTEPKAWITRFNERFHEGNPLREARLKESVLSLEWSLAQTNDDHCIITNYEGNPEHAAEEVIRRLQGETLNQSEARQFAQACLAAARKELA